MGSNAASIGSNDPEFSTPFVDIDEQRDTPVPHRYVHGGFEGTDTKFSIYFPPADRYEGRFFQPLMPISGTENAAPFILGMMMGGSIEFAIDSGGYLVESNLGRTVMFPGPDATLVGYRASAAVARYSRVLAAEMYGEHRAYGYVFGGSGGAFKTIGCVESAPDVWDGAVPFVHGSPISMPHVFTVQAHALRVLTPKLEQIVDAVEPGGSGDMYAGLNGEEREALAEVTRMGFPARAWFDAERIAAGYTGVFSSLVDDLVAWDPTYVEDFWSKPGYLGANPPASLTDARIEHKTTIAQVVLSSEASALGLPMAMSAMFGDNDVDLPAALRLEDLPEGDIRGAGLHLQSGKGAGNVLYIASVQGNFVMTGFGERNAPAMQEIEVGDEVLVDNGVYLASQTYHRHAVPSPDFYVWDQFTAAGEPVYPQRDELVAPRFARNAAGSIQSGRFACKMIVVEALVDEAAFAWQADWYRTKVQEVLGDRLDDSYRLWFIDHAMHTSPQVGADDPRPVRTTRVVPYVGALQQALRDVAAWAEQGTTPPPSTEYVVNDGQVEVPATAAERRGVQPVATLQVEGGVRADVAVGQTVHFSAVVEAPPTAGLIVAAEWDFDGSGAFAHAAEVDGNLAQIKVATTHTFDTPGTYFPSLRVASQRQGDLDTPHARVQNLARVRVVVS